MTDEYDHLLKSGAILNGSNKHRSTNLGDKSLITTNEMAVTKVTDSVVETHIKHNFSSTSGEVSGCALTTSNNEDDIDTNRMGASESKSSFENNLRSSAITKIPVAKDDPCYNMDHENRGIAVIINLNISNESTQHQDVNYTEKMFIHMGFEVLIWNDYDIEILIKELKELSELDHSNNDCFAVCLLTHEHEFSSIYVNEVEMLLNLFTAEKCPTLAGKFKMVLLDIPCVTKLERGSTMCKTSNTEVDSPSASYKLPIHADFLITYNDTNSFREPDQVSLFIHSLYLEIMNSDLAAIDICRIMNRVRQRIYLIHKSLNNSLVQEQNDMPIDQSTLIRKVYFKPKIKCLPELEILNSKFSEMKMTDKHKTSNFPDNYKELNSEFVKLNDITQIPVIKDNAYNIDHENRGIAVIINNDTFDDPQVPFRKGSLKDTKELAEILFQRNFEVLIWNNFYFKELCENLEELAKKDHSKNDCFVMVVLSHGTFNSYINSRNCLYKVEMLLNFFNVNKCPTLAGKAKYFFIQACRGKKLDSGITLGRVTTKGDSPTTPCKMPKWRDSLVVAPIYKLPTDCMLAFCQYDGYYSFRSPYDGSWFIQSLILAMRENNPADSDFSSIITSVSRTVALRESYSDENPYLSKRKQIPAIYSNLIGDVYFKNKITSPPKPKWIGEKFIKLKSQQEQNNISATTKENKKLSDLQPTNMTFDSLPCSFF